MNIIGKSKIGSDDSVIVNIQVNELERGTFYGKCIPGLSIPVRELKVGQEININELYSMTFDLVEASKAFKKANEQFEKTSKTMLKFASMIVEDEIKKEKIIK